jgi:hypothetical protein
MIMTEAAALDQHGRAFVAEAAAQLQMAAEQYRPT